MTVNHSSTLSVEYFISYLELVMNAKQISLKEASQYMNEHFFKGISNLYGENTALQFKKAIEHIEKKG